MPAKSENLCSEPHCRKPAHLIVFGKPLCEPHNAERVESAYQESVTLLRGVL